MSRKISGKAKIGIAFLFLLPALYWMVILFKFHDIATDGIQYVTIGKNLFSNGEYSSPFGLMPDWVQPPFFPFLAGIFTMFLAPNWAGILADLAAFFLLLYLLYRFAKNELKLHYYWVPVFLLFVHPLVILVNSQSLTEPLFVFLHFGLFLIFFQITVKREVNFWFVLLAGELAALLVFTRPEGILSAVLFLLILYFSKKGRRIWPVFLTIFVVILIPYGLFIKSQSGHFNVVPKISFNKRLSLVVKDYLKRNPGAIENTDRLNHYAWFAYDPAKNDLYSALIMDDNYYFHLKSKENRPSGNLKFLVNRITVNIIESLRILFASRAIPLIYLVLLLVGAYALFINSRRLFFLLVLWLIPSTYFLVSHVEERFFFVFLPYGALVATYGIDYLASRAKPRYRNIVLASVLVGVLVYNSFYYRDIYRYKIMRDGYYKIARQMEPILDAGTPLCSLVPQIPFWGDYHPIRLPICTPNQLKAYLEGKKGEFLLLGDEVFTLRKELLPIYRKQLNREFRFIQSFHYHEMEFRLFKLVTKRNRP